MKALEKGGNFFALLHKDGPRRIRAGLRTKKNRLSPRLFAREIVFLIGWFTLSLSPLYCRNSPANITSRGRKWNWMLPPSSRKCSNNSQTVRGKKRREKNPKRFMTKSRNEHGKRIGTSKRRILFLYYKLKTFFVLNYDQDNDDFYPREC